MSKMDAGEIMTSSTSQLEPVSKRRLKRIRDQLEFYFSSANLSRDKFIQQHMFPPINTQSLADTSCGYVSLSVINQFPVIKELSGSNIELIRKGAELSSYLDLSEDEMSIKRRLPVTQLTEEEITLRTIYVEHIPPKLSSHGSLKNFFSKYGSVTYVSIPNYKTQNKRKDGKVTDSSKLFAFIEFSCHQAAVAAINTFNGTNSVDKILTSEPSMLHLVISNNFPTKFGKDLTNKSSSSETNRKRRCAAEDETITTPQNVKRKKDDSNLPPSVSPIQSVEMIESSQDQEMSCPVMWKVKKKKARNRRKPGKRQRSEKMLSSISDIRQMCVMSKADWLKKKYEFKTVHKSFMGNLKLVNRQATLGVVMQSQVDTPECEKHTDKKSKKRGCDKILTQSMQIAERVFKWK